MACFGGFLHALPALPIVGTLVLWSMKGVQVVYFWVRFHLCLIVTSLVFNVQVFSNQQNLSFQAAFVCFFAHNSPKFDEICFSRSPPPTWPAHTPSLSHSMAIKVKQFTITLKKSRPLIAFFKLLLGHVKVEIVVILWHFLVFCMRPPHTH